jgi:Holliday junction DNA helicase RuvA
VIAWVEGVLRDRAPTRVVVDVRGVGYEVHVPLSTFAALPDAGKTVSLQIHTHAREGSIQLFGFATLEERTAFELLLRASRVGPRLAQTVLSGIRPADLLAAIRSGDSGPLRRVPGVGPKVADRILVELRDRADELAAALGGGETGAARVDSEGEARQQALSALVNLGYRKAEAERILDEAEEEIGAGASVESYVRAALKRLGR